MDVIGIGTEIMECVRVRKMIERHAEAFLYRVYTPREIEFIHTRKATTEYFAAWWAAKQAAFKSLGTAWRRGMAWTDVEVMAEPAAEPRLCLHGAARDLLEARGATEVMLTASWCRQFATATALAVRREPIV
jgi:holo-[acyl-carrier protein] synthase